MTLPIVDRAFYERMGYVLYPDHHHMYCDNDLEDVSRRLGQLIEAKHLLFPHRHYIAGAAPFDEMYRRPQRYWNYDAHVYHKRRVRDFGLRPRTFGDFANAAGWTCRIFFAAAPGDPQGRDTPPAMRLPFQSPLRSPLPQRIRRGQPFGNRLRAHRRRRRLGRHDRTPEGAAPPLSPSLAGLDTRAPQLAIIVPRGQSWGPATLSHEDEAAVPQNP